MAGFVVLAARATGWAWGSFQPVLMSIPGIAAASLAAPASVTLLCQTKTFFRFFNSESLARPASEIWVP